MWVEEQFGMELAKCESLDIMYWDWDLRNGMDKIVTLLNYWEKWIFVLKKEKLRRIALFKTENEKHWNRVDFERKCDFQKKSAASRWFMHGCVRWLILGSDGDRGVARLVWLLDRFPAGAIIWCIAWPMPQWGRSEICFAYLIPTTVFGVELFSVCVCGCVGVCVRITQPEGKEE